MIYTYNFSIRGTDHETSGKPCQDYSAILNTRPDGWVIAASADGVGSANHAEIGSQLAVEVALQVVNENFYGSAKDDVLSIIRSAFQAAMDEIHQRAIADNNSIDEYDTTLDLAVYNGETLHYGHSGDGGIIGLGCDGAYVPVTQPQKDGRYVIPLRAGLCAWDVGTYSKPLTSVLLATDGIWNTICPYKFHIAKMQGVALLSDLYIPLCAFFLDPAWFSTTQEEPRKIIRDFINNKLPKDEFYQYLRICYSKHLGDEALANTAIEGLRVYDMPLRAMCFVSDDITTVGLVNMSTPPPPQACSYYREVDWEAVELAVRKIMFPHLYLEATDGEIDVIVV